MSETSIVFKAKDTIELEKYEISEPGDNQVGVRLCYSTISAGTERANLHGEVNIGIYTYDTEAHFPRYSGYSSSGIVEKVGKNVKSVKIGDRVALSWSLHRSYIVIGEENVHKIEDDNVSLKSAALALISTFPMAAIRKCRLEIGESAIVMGLGVLGLCAVKLLRAAGAYPIIAADPIESKRRQAVSYGADYAFDPCDEDFAEKVKAVTHGGAKAAIEVTGIGKALDQVLDCMAVFGRVSLLGCTRNSDFSIDYYHKVHGKGVSLIGAHTMARPKTESSSGLWTTHDDIMAILGLVSGKRLDLESMIEETHSPLEAPTVYERLVTEKGFPVVQFDWGKLK